jgi:hypothetical protein
VPDAGADNRTSDDCAARANLGPWCSTRRHATTVERFICGTWHYASVGGCATTEWHCTAVVDCSVWQFCGSPAAVCLVGRSFVVERVDRTSTPISPGASVVDHARHFFISCTGSATEQRFRHASTGAVIVQSAAITDEGSIHRDAGRRCIRKAAAGGQVSQQCTDARIFHH